MVSALKESAVLNTAGIVGGRVFARVAPANTAYPYVVLSEGKPTRALGNGGLEVLTTYPVLVSVYGKSRAQNATAASKVKIAMNALSDITLSGGAILLGTTLDPKGGAAPGQGVDAQAVIIYSDNLGYLVYVQPVQI